MTRRRATALALALILPATPGQAGHGLMNTFADLAPLPAPGVTAATWYWRIERLAEALARAFAATPAMRQAQALAEARERLAELEVVAVAGAQGAVTRTLDAYARSLADAAAATGAGPRERRQLALALARALLEQHYLLSLDYLELARAARPPLAAAVAVLAAHYAELRAGLPAGIADSLFFAEEEVRWSWEMAERGHAQGM